MFEEIDKYLCDLSEKENTNLINNMHITLYHYLYKYLVANKTNYLLIFNYEILINSLYVMSCYLLGYILFLEYFN